MSLDTAQFCYMGSRIGWVSVLQVYLCESEREKVHDDRSANLSVGGGKMSLQLCSRYLQRF